MEREEMTKRQERIFVNNWFKNFENEGFAKVFWSLTGNFKEYHNKPFKVLERATENDCDLECLPMWKIRFRDGKEIFVYPDEIIPSEMISNGCKLKIK